MPADAPIARLAAPGWVGVEVFFVISGFVIPYALDREGYLLSDFPRFLLKRLVRLDPPYIASILVVLLAATYTWIRMGDQAFPFSLPQVLLHIGYVNVFFGYAWLAPVYWTLAIELQYYILVGVAFPLIKSAGLSWLAVVVVAIVLSLVIRNSNFVFQYFPLFLTGLAAFHFRLNRIRPAFFLFLCLAFGAASWWTINEVAAVIGVLSGLAIGLLNVAPLPLVWMGRISYPLYLLHASVGYTVSAVFTRRLPGSPPLIIAFTALAASIGAAYLLHIAIESPSQRLSSRIHYKRQQAETQVALERGAA